MHTLNLFIIFISVQYISSTSQKIYDSGQLSNSRSRSVSGKSASKVASSINNLEEVTDRSNGPNVV